MDFRIRSAELRDLQQIVNLDRSCFINYGTHEGPEVFKQRIKVFKKGCFVLEIKKQIRGYITSEKWREMREPKLNEDAFVTHKEGGKIFNITALAIAKESRRKGLGTALLNKLINIASREMAIHIIVQTSNARKFYEENGFRFIGLTEQQVDDEPQMDLLIYNFAS